MRNYKAVISFKNNFQIPTFHILFLFLNSPFRFLHIHFDNNSIIKNYLREQT